MDYTEQIERRDLMRRLHDWSKHKSASPPESDLLVAAAEMIETVIGISIFLRTSSWITSRQSL